MRASAQRLAVPLFFHAMLVMVERREIFLVLKMLNIAGQNGFVDQSTDWVKQMVFNTREGNNAFKDECGSRWCEGRTIGAAASL